MAIQGNADRLDLHAGNRSNGRVVNTRSNQQQEERPDPTLYVNVGLWVEFQDPDTGEMVEEFVSMPFGITPETMNRAKVPPSNGDPKRENYRKKMQIKNHILDQILGIGGQMNWGSAKYPKNLSVEIRKVGDPNLQNQLPAPDDTSMPVIKF